MAYMSFFEEMKVRKYRPVYCGGCSNCAATADCIKIHKNHKLHDSCFSFFMSELGYCDGHWVKAKV